MLIGSLGSRNFVTRNGIIGQDSSSSTSSGSSTAAQRTGVRDFMTRLIAAGQSIQSFQADFSDIKAGSTRTIQARNTGGSKVALNTRGSKSVLSSASEISTATTAVEDRNPAWGNPVKSTSEITVHGTYTGTADAEYSIHSGNTRGFNIGSNATYKLRVFKNGTRITPNIVIPKRYTAGTQLTVELGSGLSVSFTEDAITKRDSFTINALTGVDVAADPDEAFDGSTGGLHNLDSTVTAGTFEVNGTTITVAADDTINTVVDTINASGAGVTAAYNSSDDSVSLTSTTVGANTITVGSDTSGFLAAMKLDTATTELGEGDERGQAIDQVELLAGVSSGTFEINGTTISVDVTTDTLEDLIERVNDSDAGALMSYSATTDRLSIRNASGDADLTVENDTTGLFSTFGVEEGTSESRKSRGISSRVITEMVDQVAQMVELLNQMSNTVAYESVISDGTSKSRDQLRAAIRNHFNSSKDDIDTDFGLKFNVADDSTQAFAEFGKAGEKELTRALKRNPNAVLESLFGTNSKSGLMDNILTGMERAQATMTKTYGSVGLVLDTRA